MHFSLNDFNLDPLKGKSRLVTPLKITTNLSWSIERTASLDVSYIKKHKASQVDDLSNAYLHFHIVVMV